jgi:hypothetical protein
MPRYKIWDKQEGIYTPGVDKNGKGHWSAAEYIAKKAPWAANPNIKVIVGGGAINGAVFMEFGTAVEHYRRAGAAIENDMTDAEVLSAIEAFEDTPPSEPAPSPEERMAAAMEYSNLANMEDI